MKRIITYIILMLLASAMFAQNSDLLSYQSVIRDDNQVLVVNQSVGVQISILQGSVTGSIVYEEVQTSSTNINGLLSLQIGNSPGFDTINWANGPFFIQVEIDPTGGTNYTIVGKSQLLSVPFSLYSKMAEELSGPINEVDPVFAASVASGITGADTAYWNNKLDEEVDGDPTNELQNIYLQSDSIVVLTDGGFFILPPEEDPIFAASVAAGITEADTANWNAKVGVEVDPVFAASIAAGITGMDTAYWNAKLDAEVDPIFAASVAAGITQGDTANWNAKVGVEVDPVFAASIAAGITDVDTAYWNAKLDAEVDPIFAASIAYGITGLDTSYWNSKLDAEVDPIFASSIAYGITGTDTAYWNSKLDAEVDPIFAASIASGITGMDTAYWNAKLDAEIDPVFAASIAAGITGADTALWNSNTPVWSKNGNDVYYNSGNVGIGTSSPLQAFHVNGNSYLDGDLDVTGSIQVDTINFKTEAAISSYGPFRLEIYSGFEFRLKLGGITSDFRNSRWRININGGVNNDIIIEDHGTSFYTGLSATQAIDVNGNILARGSIMTDLITPNVSDHVTIDDVIRLVPRSSAPSPAQEGMIYSNSSDNHLYFYNGTSWVQLDN